jgi:hypothetical protein
MKMAIYLERNGSDQETIIHGLLFLFKQDSKR